MADQTKEYTKELVRLSRKDRIPISYQKLTFTGAVDVPTIPAGTTYMYITIESATLTGAVGRWLDTGETPTAGANGHFISHGDRFDVVGAVAVNQFKIIADSGSHSAHITFYK